MLRLLTAILCAIVLAHSLAWAVGEKACTSITERDCAPLPRVSTDPDLRVEILTRHRQASFPLSTAPDLSDELSAVCQGGRCLCNENIEYLDFKGAYPGFRQVNAAEHAAAIRQRCTVELSDVDRQIVRYEVTHRIVSIAAFELEYCHTCGGSCHGTTALAAFDAETGVTLRVRDALKPGAADALRRHMINFIVAKFGADAGEAYVRKQLGDELSRRPLLDEGLYAEKGTLYVNLDSFVLGCAGGSFYPVPVPPALIAPSFATLLN
jgi:hypothetical protein